MTQTYMRQEIDEIPAAIERLLQHSGADLAHTARLIADSDPLFIATIARGSSDHAAHFLKYAFEITLGLPGASLGPSLASVYGIVPRTQRALVMAISQSGKSPDIVAMAEAAKRGGGQTIALVNTSPSPLSDICSFSIDICAGKETSVAATKSFVCSIVAGLQLLSHISGDTVLRNALTAFPDQVRAALRLDWIGQLALPDKVSSAYILGRGPSFAIAQEAALKFKETCAIHAEAFSSAEVMHGPVELVGRDFPVIVLAGRDEAETGTAEMADALAMQGAMVFASSAKCRHASVLLMPEADHPLLSALLQIVPCYTYLEALARRLGRNPDQPARLCKVTQTI